MCPACENNYASDAYRESEGRWSGRARCRSRPRFRKSDAGPEGRWRLGSKEAIALSQWLLFSATAVGHMQSQSRARLRYPREPDCGSRPARGDAPAP